MSMLDGVSQCWPLAKDCRVWWEAWSAFFSGLAVVVTAVAALAVFVMSRAANRVSGAIHDQAESARRREGDFLLAYLFAEAVNARAIAVACINTIERTGRKEFLAHNAEEKASVFSELKGLTMPTTESVLTRLHVLDEIPGVALARALSTVLFLQLGLRVFDAYEPDDRGMKRLDSTIDHLKVVRDNLEVFQAEARRARGEVRQ